jgi:hypothetical protein
MLNKQTNKLKLRRCETKVVGMDNNCPPKQSYAQLINSSEACINRTWWRLLRSFKNFLHIQIMHRNDAKAFTEKL